MGGGGVGGGGYVSQGRARRATLGAAPGTGPGPGHGEARGYWRAASARAAADSRQSAGDCGPGGGSAPGDPPPSRPGHRDRDRYGHGPSHESATDCD